MQELMLKLKSSLIAPPAKNQSLVQVRNAEPYREFQSSEDNDRYYGMNEVLISRERRTGQKYCRVTIKINQILQGYN